MMGSGKSTVGRLLAERLGSEFLDSDEEVERVTGRTVAEIWATEGEAAFRGMESAALATALDAALATALDAASDPARRPGPPMVVAGAGGVVLDPANRALLAGEPVVVWLRARPETLAARIAAHVGATGRGDRSDHRPLLATDAQATLARLCAERGALYEEVATAIVDVDDLDGPGAVEAVLAALRVGPS